VIKIVLSNWVVLPIPSEAKIEKQKNTVIIPKLFMGEIVFQKLIKM